MPFRPSHAVVALPFARVPLVPAGMAVGAMTPDLPLFLRGTPIRYEWTHSIAWLPATTLLALALLVVWRCVLRPGVRDLVPAAIARRLPPDWDAPAGPSLRALFASRSRAAWLLLALGAGAASHIAWDLFTHVGRAGVVIVPALAERWGPLAGYTWLQHGSSVAGVVILGIWMLRWIARSRPGPLAVRVLPRGVPVALALALPVILGAAWVVGWAMSGPFDAELSPQQLAYRVLPPASAAWALLTVAVCALVQVRRGAARRRLPA
jgi:hypothetical protein